LMDKLLFNRIAWLLFEHRWANAATQEQDILKLDY